ncbi:hypothetical protein [Streptomyces swartbergensis]|uniref:hypothetical protein n=1 Tax=Streptomyces swartbergensis TaxID=487165 RepID=UPI0037F770B6
MTDTVYRFLPWSRRGLSAAVPGAPDGSPVPDRAKVHIEVVVGGAGTVSTKTALSGPGEVIGLDPTVIVRTVPRPNSTNVEPNYLAAVEFDQPELPWLFTPTGVPPSGHLAPWLVLVVVRDRPEVTVSAPAGAVLPRLTIESGAAAELPDLRESWAWAHVQLLDEDAGTTPGAVGAALADHPNRNVSRLVCPRRLEPNARWIAALVPAFDAGVDRGLGRTPKGGDLQPAWATGADSVTLPAYYHWRFQTGPQGDFESLARRLKAYEAGARIGRVKMHVREGSPFPDRLPVGDPARFLDMDGALQAPAIARSKADPKVPDSTLGQVPEALRSGLAKVTRVMADAADGVLDGQAPEDGESIGPPVYAGAHIRRTSVADTDDTWFRELNTDPRPRVAAGLGAEVMRTYQEEVMEACWQQVGDVLAVEAALSRARLSLEAARRVRERHLAPLPSGRLLQLAAPLADRTLLDGLTLPKAIATSSLPDRATDAAMRRYTAATGRVMSGVRRRAARAAVTVDPRQVGERLVSTLARGRVDVDPTRYPVPAIDGLPGPLPGPGPDGSVALESLGVRVVVDKVGAAALGKAARELRAAPVLTAREMLAPRADLRATGLLTSVHLAAAREAAVGQLADRMAALPADGRPRLTDVLSASPSHVMHAVSAAAAALSGDAGFLIETGTQIVVRPLGLRRGGELVVLTPPGVDNVPLARLDRRLIGDAHEIGELIGRLPGGTLRPPGRLPGGRLTAPVQVVLRPGASHGEVVVAVGGGAGAAAGGPAAISPTVTMPPLVKDADVIARYESAVAELARRSALGEDPAVPELVAFALAQAGTALLERCDPVTVHPARLDTMISVAGHGLGSVLADPTLVPHWRLPLRFDRVMAHPRLGLPAYSYLAQYDRTRFCPGVDEVPPESITLLETNPRFIAAFMAGLNHETNKELLWRGYPTDGRGTPWQKFWQRKDDRADIFEVHTWGSRHGRDDLPAQTHDPKGNLVLLLRGELVRRYPNVMAVAVKAERVAGREKPSDKPADLRVSVFAGQFDPDVSFFGFPLDRDDLTTGDGWFFGLLEPVTEPRFGFDETPGRAGSGPAAHWNEVAWPDLAVPPAGVLRVGQLAALGLSPSVGQADGVAAATFQRPFKLLVHARHLVKGI